MSWSDKTFEPGQDYLSPGFQFKRMTDTHVLPSLLQHVLVFIDKNLDDHMRWFNKATGNTGSAIETKMAIYCGLDEDGNTIFRDLNKTLDSYISDKTIVGWCPMPTVQRITPYPDAAEPKDNEIEKIIFQAPELSCYNSFIEAT